MTSHPLYELHETPELSTPVMFVGLSGWVDAGDVLERALEAICCTPYLLVASFDADQLIDYRARRPVVQMDGGINIGIIWPSIELLATHDADGRDIVVLRGVEPDYGWKRFTVALLDLAQRLKVRLVVPIGAYPAAVPHTRPVRLSATGTTPLLVERIGYIDGRVDAPAGIHAAIERECAERGVASVGVWATVPHYAASVPYPEAAVALLGCLEDLAERRFDRTALETEAEHVRRRLDRWVASSEDHQLLVSRLEEHTEQVRLADDDLPSGEDLAVEFQRFLEDES